MIRKLLTALAVLSVAGGAIADSKVLSMKDRAETIDMLLQDRVETVLPALMRNTGIDMWIIISREYNEDPVIKTFLPARWHAARRTDDSHDYGSRRRSAARDPELSRGMP